MAAKLFWHLCLAMGLLLSLPTVAQTLFRFQGSAQARCSTDTVVWLNTRSGIYHFHGERRYRRTKQGA
jgi:hypothetical protein